jgi:hypothetical protein
MELHIRDVLDTTACMHIVEKYLTLQLRGALVTLDDMELSMLVHCLVGKNLTAMVRSMRDVFGK